jgi:hypothetical protein
MAAKLKMKDEGQYSYSLKLDYTELLLISKLVSHIRLGDDNEYSDAAGNLCEAISKYEESIHDAAMDEIGFNIVLENEHGETVALLDGSDSIIEVYSNYDEDLFDV